MGVRFTGPWDKVKLWLRRAATGSVGKQANEQLQAVGEETVKRVKKHIQSQDLGWPPLSRETIRKKGHPKIYVDSGAFVSNIKMQVKEGRFKTTIFVGPTQQSTRTGLTFQQLAAYMEYGTSRMPARPVWRPSYDEVKADNKPWEALLDTVVEDF
jgi:hypothetical protein